MSLSTDVIRLVVGMLIGMVLPRIPLLFFTRFLNMEQGLPPHPDSVPIGIPLVQRLLLMRRIHFMCWITATLPLALGLWILQNSPDPFAFGMVAGVSWFAISRIVPEDIEQGFGILSMSVIKSVNNLREPETDCCGQSMSPARSSKDTEVGHGSKCCEVHNMGAHSYPRMIGHEECHGEQQGCGW